MTIHDFKWTMEPDEYLFKLDRIEITTMPHNELWQRIYYHFPNDNAPVLQMEKEEKFFSFIVKRISPKAIIALTIAVLSCTWTARTG